MGPQFLVLGLVLLTTRIGSTVPLPFLPEIPILPQVLWFVDFQFQQPSGRARRHGHARYHYFQLSRETLRSVPSLIPPGYGLASTAVRNHARQQPLKHRGCLERRSAGLLEPVHVLPLHRFQRATGQITRPAPQYCCL